MQGGTNNLKFDLYQRHLNEKTSNRTATNEHYSSGFFFAIDYVRKTEFLYLKFSIVEIEIK